jgi:CBS domain-containing protein
MPEKIQDIMTRTVETVPQNATVGEVARVMRDRAIGDVLVTDDSGELCGILTDRDLVIRVLAEDRNPDQVRVGEICTAHAVTLDPAATVEKAIELMRANAIRRIPVVENNRAIGIVSIGDLAKEKDPRSALGEISSAAPNN